MSSFATSTQLRRAVQTDTSVHNNIEGASSSRQQNQRYSPDDDSTVFPFNVGDLGETAGFDSSDEPILVFDSGSENSAGDYVDFSSNSVYNQRSQVSRLQPRTGGAMSPLLQVNKADMVEVEVPNGKSTSSPRRPRSARKISVTVNGGDGVMVDNADEGDVLDAHVLDIVLSRDTYDEDYAFEITGGVDSGAPLIISAVYREGAADLAGLCRGDILLGVDGIAASKLSHTDTVQIIKEALQIKLKVQRLPADDELEEAAAGVMDEEEAFRLRKSDRRRNGSINGGMDRVRSSSKHEDRLDGIEASGELNNQAYAWIDTRQQPCSPPPEQEPSGSMERDVRRTNRLAPERKCLLVVSEDVHLGLLIRGGLEYGLGIYVTGLDQGSAAQAADLQIGDQILAVNGDDFRRISHNKAVRILRSHRHMTLKVHYIGKLPYARRLTAPSSISSSSSPRHTAQHSPNRLYTNAVLLPASTAEEEIDALTREAMLDQINPDNYPDELEPPHFDPYAFDEPAFSPFRPRARRKHPPDILHSHNENNSTTLYWLSLVEKNANILLDDDTQKEALMYFLREYLSGSMCVDALVLSLFQGIDSFTKFQLLDDIRNMVAVQDIHRYDSLTSGLKAEWMSSPANLFSGINQSNAELDLLNSLTLNESLATIKPLPVTPLKPALKNTSSLFFSDIIPNNVQSIYQPAPVEISQPSFIQQPPSILSTILPVNQGTWSAADFPNVSLHQNWANLNAPQNVPVQYIQTLVTPATPLPPSMTLNQVMNQPTVFTYDVPQVDHYYPSQNAEMMPQNRMTFRNYNSLDFSSSAPNSSSMFRPDRKSYSIDHLPYNNSYSDNIRRRPSYDSINDTPYRQPSTYDYSDTPAGRAMRSQKTYDVGRDRSYDSLEERSRGPSPKLSYSPSNGRTDSPRQVASRMGSSSRNVNRGSVGSVDEYQQSPKRELKRVVEKARRTSGTVSAEEHMYSGYVENTNGMTVSRSRPQTLQVVGEVNTNLKPGESPTIIETIKVKKSALFLGLAIEGGTDTVHPLPRIINIQPGGSAHRNGMLKVGHVIISINGKKFDNFNHAQCVSTITELFKDKSSDYLEFIVKNTVKPAV